MGLNAGYEDENCQKKKDLTGKIVLIAADEVPFLSDRTGRVLLSA